MLAAIADHLPSSYQVQEWLWSTVAGLIIYTIPRVHAWLSAHADAAKVASADTHLSTMAAVSEQLKAFLLEQADQLLQKNLPRLAQSIKSGDLATASDVHNELEIWGSQLKHTAIDVFNERGLDIVKTFGDEYINNLISHVADKVSPVPGLPTSLTLLKPEVVDALLDKGIEYVRQHVIAGQPKMIEPMHAITRMTSADPIDSQPAVEPIV